MGGSVSRFEENDWERATGELRSFPPPPTSSADGVGNNNSNSSPFSFSSSAQKEADASSCCDATIDGASPTLRYGVYYLTKRNTWMNQREFDITDADHNLLYTTRAVPKTIACFDVLGRELNDYILRVTVDLARRYWIVYRYRVASFPGQKPDFDETAKIAMEYAERNESTPILFRKCCIVVSWSRYMAITAMFGPASPDKLGSDKPEPDSDGDVENEAFESVEESEATEIEDKDTAKDAKETEMMIPPSTSEQSPQESSSEIKQTTSENGNHHNIPTSVSLPELPVDADAILTSHSDPSPPHMVRSASSVEVPSPSSSEAHRREMRRSVSVAADGHEPSKRQEWFHYSQQQSQQKVINHNRSNTDPMEGVIQLDGPLLLCQEVFTRIVGNHQTCLVDKAKVLDLLKQDKQYLTDHPTEIHANGGGDGDVSDNPPPPLLLQPPILIDQESSRHGTDETNDAGNGVEETKESVVDEDHKDDHEKPPPPSQKQPLVGYWAWENTLRTHKMKMHVAKDADLALHIVMAIIVNQVRTERNHTLAIALPL